MTIKDYEKYIAQQLLEVNHILDNMALDRYPNINPMDFSEIRARVKCIKDHKGNYLLSQHIRS